MKNFASGFGFSLVSGASGSAINMLRLFWIAATLCFLCGSFALGQSPNDGFAPLMPGSSEGSAGVAVAVQPDGKVIFGGGFVESPGTSRRKLTRLRSDGTLDSAFNC
jgi:hypothetical protein